MRRWWALGVLVVLWAPELAAAPTGRFPDPPGKAPNPGETTRPPPPTPAAAAPAAPAPAAPAPAAPAPAAPVPRPATESWATRSARLLTEQADALARRGEFARALTVYHQAVVMDPSFAEAYFGLGKLRQRQGDTREAERIYTQAARLRNGGAKAFELRARLRYVSGRQLEALTDLAEALRLEPEDVPRLELASQWYVAQQAWPAALAVWRRLLAIYRDRGQADAARRAQIQVQALTILAGDSDPVSAPNHSGWVPNALRHISLRGG